MASGFEPSTIVWRIIPKSECSITTETLPRSPLKLRCITPSSTNPEIGTIEGSLGIPPLLSPGI